MAGVSRASRWNVWPIDILTSIARSLARTPLTGFVTSCSACGGRWPRELDPSKAVSPEMVSQPTWICLRSPQHAPRASSALVSSGAFSERRRSRLSPRSRMCPRRHRHNDPGALAHRPASINDVWHIPLAFGGLRANERFGGSSEDLRRVEQVEKHRADHVFANGANAVDEKEPALVQLDRSAAGSDLDELPGKLWLEDGDAASLGSRSPKRTPAARATMRPCP